MNSHEEKAKDILERFSQSGLHVTVAEAQVHAILALVEELKRPHGTRPIMELEETEEEADDEEKS